MSFRRGRWLRGAIAAAVIHGCFASAACAAQIAPGERRSGYEFMSAETRAMQDDDATNPATSMLEPGPNTIPFGLMR